MRCGGCFAHMEFFFFTVLQSKFQLNSRFKTFSTEILTDCITTESRSVHISTRLYGFCSTMYTAFSLVLKIHGLSIQF